MTSAWQKKCITTIKIAHIYSNKKIKVKTKFGNSIKKAKSEIEDAWRLYDMYVADEYMIFGYKHTLEVARTSLDTIRNRSFEENLAKRSKLPYTDWWYTQQVDTFLEEAK